MRNDSTAGTTTGEGRKAMGRTLRGLGLSAGLAALLAGYAVTSAPAVPAPVMTPVAEQNPMRQSEAAAAARAAEIGERVEIGSQRAERRTVYANPNGTTTAIEHTQPVRVVRDNAWTPVDATLVAAPDGSVGPRAATFGLRLSGGGDGKLLTAERAGRTLSLDWPGALPRPAVTGGRATYAEVLPGVDLVVSVTPDSFSHVLVIKTAEAAENPELSAVELGLRTTGLTVRENEAGGLAAVDEAAGGAVFEAPRPTMWDSPAQPATAAQKSAARTVNPAPQDAVEAAPESSTEVPLAVEVDADSLTLLPDQKMLKDPGTTFPVYVDPVFSTSKRSAYAMVAEGFPNQSYWSFAKEPDEGVGECPVSSGWCNGVLVKRLFYTVPTPYVGMEILEAKFAVTMVATYNSDAKGVSLYRAGGGITSSTDWNNQPAMSELMQTISPTGKRDGCESANQNVRFDVSDAFDDVNRGKLKALTFGMRAVSETDYKAWKRFCGNGQLEVTYNRKPNVPPIAKLTSSPGGSCVSGAARPTVSAAPTLYMYVSDPDHSTKHVENVRAKVVVTYRKPDNSTATTEYLTAYKAGDGKTRLQVSLPATLPQGVVISWRVQAGDTADSWSGLSSPACEFIYDKTAPPEPDIDSPEFLPLDAADTTGVCVPDDEDRGYAGLYGTFTFDVPGTDAVRYQYGFDEDPKYDLIPKKADGTVNPGGPVSLRHMPEQAGTREVRVRAYDKANNPSTVAVCQFGVTTRLAAGEWYLGEQPGSTAAADARNLHPVDVPADVTLGVGGPGCQNAVGACDRDRAARFTGAGTSFLASRSSALVDTSKAFSATAWVKLADDGQERIAVSQDGSGQPGFTLGLDAATKKWAFKIPTTDVHALGGWASLSGTTAVKNEWTHLAGVYDAEKLTVQLYVNGVAQTAMPRRSAFRSRGAVQIGRRLDRGGYRGAWKGDLADVAVFDRVVPGKELGALVKLRPIRVGYWPLNAVAAGRSPERDGVTARDLLLEGGAEIRTPDPADPFADTALIGPGELKLDGVDDRARTAGPVVPMDGSFTVTARVRLATDGCSRNMTVVSQAGTKASGFRIRCTADDYWQLVVSGSDETAPAKEATVTDEVRFPSGDQEGQALAVVYNAFTRELWFYVDGELSSVDPVTPAAMFNAGGGLQIGRAMVAGAFGEQFAGVIDDVRVYGGTVDPATVALLAQRLEQSNL